jgi:diguanylate cyclase (GGDEF)-like protein/PAS domain S-box-containing protein
MEAPLGAVRALLVDDDGAYRALTRTRLTELGAPAIDLHEAASCSELDAARAVHPFDVYLLDHGLPDGDGLEAAREILASEPEAVIVMLTGRDDLALDGAAEELGIITSLPKDGCDAGALGRTIRHGVRLQRERRVLRESDRRYEEAQAIARVGSWRLDLPTGRGTWSREMFRIYGLEAAEGVPSHPEFLELIAPADRARVDEVTRAARERGEPFALEHDVVASDGGSRRVHTRGEVVLDAYGVVVALIGTTQDVTELRDAERRLRDSEGLFRAAFEDAPVGVAVCAVDGTILSANPAAARLLGLERDDPVRHALDALIHPSELDDHLRHLWALVGGEIERYTLETRLVHADGHELCAQLDASTLHPSDGRGRQVIVHIQDITERKRAREELVTTAEGLADAQAIAQVGSWEWDIRADAFRWSDQLARIFGRPPADCPPDREAFLRCLHPDDEAEIAVIIEESLATGRPYTAEHRVLRPDGEVRTVLARGEPFFDGDGRPLGLRGTGQDVTERRRSEAALREAQERFRGAFEEAPIGMAVTTLEGRFLEVNRSLCELTGYGADQLLTLPGGGLTHPEDQRAERATRIALIDGDVATQAGERRITHALGHSLWVSVQSTIIRDGAGRPLHLLTQMQDITARRRFEEQLQHMADHDPLTGLLNRRAFGEELDRHVALGRRYGLEGALLVLDLDQFKAVNDTLGHNAGDELIASAAAQLQRSLRESDVLARLGGDEFAVLLPRGGAPEARTVAAKLLRAVRGTQILGGRTGREITSSIGVALIDSASATADELLVNADLAMYDAKEEGRDRFSLYSDDDQSQPRIKARLTWLERIEEALDADNFVLHAQPILDIHRNVISHHELLLRMVTADGDLVPPGAFLYVAERFNLVSRIDRWVMERAVELLDRHAVEGQPLALTVNLSGKTLADDDFLPALERAIERRQAQPQRLTFELTETAAVTNIHLARRFAQRLQSLGCRFALDDFGAGFGSFFYLKHLPFDYLKIDGEFVRNCPDSRADQLIIKAVVEIAQGLGKETIAEFTEDDRTLRFLQRQGVDYAQGFHIGRPVPVEQALAASVD